jgi:hypothetical protein
VSAPDESEARTKTVDHLVLAATATSGTFLQELHDGELRDVQGPAANAACGKPLLKEASSQ